MHLTGIFHIEKLDQFPNHGKFELIQLEDFKFLCIFQQSIEYSDVIMVLEKVDLFIDMFFSCTISMRSHFDFNFFIRVINFFTAVYVILIKKKLCATFCICIISLDFIINFLQGSISSTHQVSFLLIIGDIFHSNGGRRSLSCFFRVFNCKFVLLLLLEMFVIDMGMNSSK